MAASKAGMARGRRVDLAIGAPLMRTAIADRRRRPDPEFVPGVPFPGAQEFLAGRAAARRAGLSGVIGSSVVAGSSSSQPPSAGRRRR